jgi:hypothetical protein
MFVVLFFSAIAGLPEKDIKRYVKPSGFPADRALPQSFRFRLYRLAADEVALIAMVQYPVHLYSTVALRVSNAPFLQGDSENSWGFGQIVALVTLLGTLLECIRGMDSKYFVSIIDLMLKKD